MKIMTIDVSQVSAIVVAITAVFSLLVSIVGIWWRVNVSIQIIRDDLGAYKTEVAEKYASALSVREVETRLVDAITALTGRIDTLIGMVQLQRQTPEERSVRR